MEAWEGMPGGAAAEEAGGEVAEGEEGTTALLSVWAGAEGLLSSVVGVDTAGSAGAPCFVGVAPAALAPVVIFNPAGASSLPDEAADVVLESDDPILLPGPLAGEG